MYKRVIPLVTWHQNTATSLPTMYHDNLINSGKKKQFSSLWGWLFCLHGSLQYMQYRILFWNLKPDTLVWSDEWTIRIYSTTICSTSYFSIFSSMLLRKVKYFIILHFVQALLHKYFSFPKFCLRVSFN